MKNKDNNTKNVPSNAPFSSLNSAIKQTETYSKSDVWLRELLKIEQCPQREDALEFQLKDLVLIAEKFGFYYASHFIKNLKL